MILAAQQADQAKPFTITITTRCISRKTTFTLARLACSRSVDVFTYEVLGARIMLVQLLRHPLSTQRRKTFHIKPDSIPSTIARIMHTMVWYGLRAESSHKGF
jgi:hypothetical protein